MIGQSLKSSFVSLCLLGAFGCSSADVVDPNATVSGFCENWANAACSSSVVLACSGADKVDAELTDDCVISQRKFCEDDLLPAKGYSSQKASECLSAVKAAYSDARLTAAEIATVRHRGGACNHLIKGPRSKGESCGSNDDCDTVQDYLCVFKSGEGSCQIPALVPNGTSCAEPDAACNAGFYCDAENCVQSKAVGKACDADYECQTGLACDPDTSKCTARVSAENCTQDSDCTTEVCDIPSGLSTGRCVSAITLASSTGICEDLR
jgi:hypothetical protein